MRSRPRRRAVRRPAQRWRRVADVAPVELERPSDRAARRLRDERRAPARGRAPAAAARGRRGARERARARSTGSPRVDVAGPGLPQPRPSTTPGSAPGSRAVLAAGAPFGCGSADAPERIQVELVSANPTGPITVASARNGAYGDARRAAARVRRPRRSSASTTTTTPGAQMDRFRASVDAVRRGEEPPEDGYQRRLRRGARARSSGDPVPRMLEQIEAALERFRIHFDTFERQSVVEAEMPEAIALLDTYEADGALWARTTAHGDDKDRVLVRSDGDADVLRRRRRLRPAQVRARLRPARLRPRRRPPRLRRPPAGARRDARAPARVARGARSTSSSTSRAAARRRRCPSAAATSSSSTTSSTRSASTPPAGTSSRAGTTRRSRSTSTSRPRRARRTRSTTSSTRTRGSPASCATPRRRRRGPAAASVPLAAEERELVKRLLELPASSREATERRAPHAIPTYAIRVADDFHRFYHHHKVLGSDAERLPARALRRDADRSSRVPRPARGRGARAHVASRAEARATCRRASRPRPRSIARCAGISRSAGSRRPGASSRCSPPRSSSAPRRSRSGGSRSRR